MAKIPTFITEVEIQEFWSTHDSVDYFDDMENDEVEVIISDKKNILILPYQLQR
ncbi:hypothetical protein ISS37_09970 [candidate division KSB1 bacterium]|nr:hypothetical protein [candidate division KSB1 bacterium]